MMKYIFVFLLTLLVLGDDSGKKCKRELIDSHNITSFLDPNKGKLVLCPNIRQSCCPSFEQFKMLAMYNDVISPHYDLLKNVIKVELQMLDKLFKNIIDQMLAKVTGISDEGARIQAIDLLQRLKKKKIDKIMKTAIGEHSNTHRYLNNMKTAYFCVICDFNYHNQIDTVRKRFAITDTSCDDLVRNTIVYSNAINRGIIPFIEGILEVHKKITKKEKVLRLAGSSHISKAVQECAAEYKISDENLSSCRKYCSYFRLNADSPAYEGYPEFFANVLMELKDYAPAGAAASQAPKSRVLAEKMSKLLKSTRRLQEVTAPSEGFVDPFDPDKLQPIDLFEANSIDPDFDDAAMIEAFKVQQLLTKGEAFDPITVVRKHYIDEYDVPMDDIESEHIFNVPSHARVDVSEYQAEVLISGIDYPTILKELNWNMTIDEVAKALVTGKRAGQKETVDPMLIVAINEIDNKYVKKFHQDVFMDFKQIKFQYRIKQLKKKGADSLLMDKKSTDETIAIVSEIVKNNEIEETKAKKLIEELQNKLKKDEKNVKLENKDQTNKKNDDTTNITTNNASNNSNANTGNDNKEQKDNTSTGSENKEQKDITNNQS